MSDYTVHMISLRYKKTDGYSCVFGNGENLVAGHIAAVKEWLKRMENPAAPMVDDLL